MVAVAHARRSIRSLALLALAVLIITSWTGADVASADTTGIDRSTVNIFIQYEAKVKYTYEGDVYDYDIKAGGSCTGWFVSTEGDIATAGHCVDPDDDQGGGKTSILKAFLAEIGASADNAEATLASTRIAEGPFQTVYAYQPTGLKNRVITEPVVAQVIDFVPFARGDHALIKLNNFGTETPPLKVAAATPERGVNVITIGFPASVSRLSDAQRLQATFNQGTISARQTSVSGVPYLQINASVSGGMSGGPVIDAKTNEVYGVNSFNPRGETGDFASATDTNQMVTFLKRNGIKLEGSSPSQQTPPGTGQGAPAQRTASPAPADGGSSTASILFGVAAILLVLGALAIAAVLLLRRKPAPAASTPQVDQQPHAPWALNEITDGERTAVRR